jgi:hypothetical protein
MIRTIRPGQRRSALLTLPIALLLTLLGALWAVPAQAAAPAQGTGAWVRAAHLIPGVGTMTIGLTPFSGDQATSGTSTVMPAPSKNGMREIAPAASYGKVTQYQQIPAGFYAIAVWPVNTPTSAPPIITGTLKATAGKAFTVAGLGTKADPRIQALSDDLTPPKAGQTRVRLLPAASSAKTVTVTADMGPTVAQNAAFGQPTGYAAVPSGAWTLKASADGSTATAATSKVNLAGGSVYTLLVLDSGQGLKVSPVVDASGLDVMPAGGAQTGGGGLAPQPGLAGRFGPSDSVVAGSGLLIAAGLLLAGAAMFTRFIRGFDSGSGGRVRAGHRS